MALNAIALGRKFPPVIAVALLAACSSGRDGPASAVEVEAAVQRAERERAAIEAKQQSARKYAQAYGSLPY